jgi:hypothetical protein
MATKAIVANGCTTMIEAAVLGTPAVTYQPVTSEEFDDDMPNSLSHRAFSVDELCTTTRAIVDGELGPLDYSKRREILDQHIAALDGPLAADRMVDALVSAKYNERQPPATLISDYAQGWLHAKLRTAVKRINMHRPGHRNNLAFHAHRFPDISAEEIMRRVTQFGKLLNRFDTIRVRDHSKHIFWIHA